MAMAAVSLLVTADASPWGLGAILSDAEGNPLEWLACPIGDVDCWMLKVVRGDCRGQAVLEALALLVALRTWAPASAAHHTSRPPTAHRTRSMKWRTPWHPWHPRQKQKRGYGRADKPRLTALAFPMT